MKLYELSEQFQRLEDMAESIDNEEDANAFAMLWVVINEAFEEKAERTACVIKNLEAEAEAIREEEKRLASRRKALENGASNLKGYLEVHMIANGMDKINGKLFTLAIQNNPPALRVDELYLPDDYWKVERKPNTAMVKAALKDGKVIPGAELVQGQGLRIR